MPVEPRRQAMMYERPRFLPGGDRALFIELGDTIDPELNRRVRRLLLTIQEAALPGLVEVVPAYRSLLVYYEPRQIRRRELRARLDDLIHESLTAELARPKVTEIPVAYGGEYGPDLGAVADHNQLSPEEVVRLHTGATYLIYMMGFIPGFAYLGGMSPRIATPRLPTPRTAIPAGSVGIAGSQTGIYPAESPAGWQVIGRTPVELFLPRRQPPALLQMGDYVRFVPVSDEEFHVIKKKVGQGTYKMEETPVTQEDESGGL